MGFVRFRAVSGEKNEDVRVAVKTGVVEMMSAGKLQPSSINVYLRAMRRDLTRSHSAFICFRCSGSTRSAWLEAYFKRSSWWRLRVTQRKST